MQAEGDEGSADADLSAALCERVSCMYGGGLEAQLDHAGLQSFAGLQEVTTRAITRLAGELYSGNVHFLVLAYPAPSSLALPLAPLWNVM